MADATTTFPPDSLREAPAVLDIEASGFGRDSYPVEVGFVLPDGQSYCTLIKPAPTWKHWDPAAERLHRIPLRTAMRAGRSVSEVATQLNERLQGRTLYCDGWAHDYVWLSVLFDAAGLTPSFKLDNLRVLLTEHEAALWTRMKQEITAEMHLPRHRASADAKILQRTLVRLRESLRQPSPPFAAP